METGEFCEPILRFLRIRKILRFIEKKFVVLDIGCGVSGNFLKQLAPHISHGIGVDKDAEPREEGNIEIVKGDADGNRLPFSDNILDCVTMLAILEHLNNRGDALREAYRVLKKDGVLLLTTPTWAAKPILEFLAFKLRIVSSEGVRDHKTYFWKKELIFLLGEAGFVGVRHTYFQLGLNNFVYARK